MCLCVHAWSCLTLCNPINNSPPGFSVYGIFQARILEWVAMSSSRGSSWPRDWIDSSFLFFMAGRFFPTVPPGKSNEWETPLQTELSLINENIFLKRVNNFYLVFRVSPVSAVSGKLSAQNNPYAKETYFGMVNSVPLYHQASQVVLVVKDPPVNSGDTRDVGSIPGSGRSPGVGMATHSSILAWKIPCTEEPGRLWSRELQRVGRDWARMLYLQAVLRPPNCSAGNRLWKLNNPQERPTADVAIITNRNETSRGQRQGP